MPQHQPYDLAHEVWVEKDSLLAKLMGDRLVGSDTCEVNSRHHQAVKTVGPGYRVSATAPDGVIEAIEDPAARFCLGVRWEPSDGGNFWRHSKRRVPARDAATKRPAARFEDARTSKRHEDVREHEQILSCDDAHVRSL